MIAEEKEGMPLSKKEYTRWQSLNSIFERSSSSFAPGMFEGSKSVLEDFQQKTKVLVVGAGGLGCEILKNLALSGLKKIHVIDMDTIDVTNLNRQFLFRMKDVGQSKAKVAAEFVMRRVPGCVITPYNNRIQEFEPNFFRQFNLCISGLDNVEARRWLNRTLCDLVEVDEGQPNMETIIPLIDGGTEGFDGQVRLFVPKLSACFECSLAILTPPRGFPVCTIAHVPRLPEHCVAYAKTILWPRLKEFKSVSEYTLLQKGEKNPSPLSIDTDNVEHMSWLFRRSEERAREFGIEGVTFKLTQQVVKNIIPAIASTNALISAAVCNEAVKVITYCSYFLDNWFMYMGQDGINPKNFQYKVNPTCIACGQMSKSLTLPKDITVRGFLNMLTDRNVDVGREIVQDYLERSVDAPLTKGQKIIVKRLNMSMDDEAKDEPAHLANLANEFWDIPALATDSRQKFLKQFMVRKGCNTEYVLPNKPEEVLRNPTVESTAEEVFSLLQIDPSLTRPSLNAEKEIYISGILASRYEQNLDQPLSTFVPNKCDVDVTDAKTMGENRVSVTLTYA